MGEHNEVFERTDIHNSRRMVQLTFNRSLDAEALISVLNAQLPLSLFGAQLIRVEGALDSDRVVYMQWSSDTINVTQATLTDFFTRLFRGS